jgi:hypothetical protein
MRTRVAVLLVCASIILGFPQESGAQWEKAGGLRGGAITSFATKEAILFASTVEGGIFLSTNNGGSWRMVSTGLPAKAKCWCLVVSEANLFVGTAEHGVYLSTNNGGWWKAANTGLREGVSVNCFAAIGTKLFAGTDDGVFLSTDGGASWKAASSGLPAGKGVNCFAGSETNLFASTLDCVYLSTDNGAGWAPVKKGLPKDVNIYSLAVGEGDLFAGTELHRMLLYAHNRGQWEAVKAIPEAEIYCFAASGANLFAGTGGGLDMMMADGAVRMIPHGAGVLLSTDKGSHWKTINTGLRPASNLPLLKGRVGFYIKRLAVCGPYLFAGTQEGEIYRVPLSALPAK